MHRLIIEEMLRQGGMKMARRAILVSFALFLLLGGSIFSEQGVEQKPKDINQQLKAATALRTAGIVIFSVGVVSSMVAGMYLMGTGFAGMSYMVTGYPEAARNAEAWNRSFQIAGIGGLVCVLVGPILWIGGAHRIREIKKSGITFQILGPDLSWGRSLGGISLVDSY
jgi:hypothetical protein